MEEDFLPELAQLANTIFVDQELARLQAKAAALQTAKAAYLQALQKSLPVLGYCLSAPLRIQIGCEDRHRALTCQI
jgi:hypothetical protein